MAGIICPKCNHPIGVKNTIKGENCVDRYRRCDCGGSVPTVEVPKAEYRNTVRLANTVRAK